MKTLTHERLKEVLLYFPHNGEFCWRGKDFKRKCGCFKRYVEIRIDGKYYLAHRLAWFYMTGEWPSQDIDHEDTNKHNNQWDNLRLTTESQNMQNQRKAQSDSSTGLLGVVPVGKTFQARICLNGKTKHIGVYKTAEIAHAAYIEAKRKYHEFNTL